MNKKIAEDYILGNEIEGYSLEELENSRKFMMLVINMTNDHNFYNLCSEKLKNNYEFVKYLILKFKNSTNFICNVADYYLAKNKDELSKVELNILMKELTIKNKEINKRYSIVTDAIYASKRVQIEIAKRKFKSGRILQDIGMGFIVIFDSFNSSEIILRYYAKNIIDEILYYYHSDLENMLHKQFNTSNQINKVGINNLILKFIGCYDPMLASYLSANIDLVKPIREEISNIQKNWDKYESLDEEKKYNLILEKVHEYMEQVESSVVFTETDILYYAARKLGIAEKIAKYDGIDREMYEMVTHDVDDEFFEKMIKGSQKDAFCYKTVMNIITSILFSKDDNQSSDGKCKVLKIDFNKKK